MAFLDDVRSAVAALMAIHNDEVAALLRGNFDGIAQLRFKLGTARALKPERIELYREHVTSHGC